MVYIIARCVLEQLQKPHTVKKKNTEKLKRKTVYVSCRSRDREHQSIGYKLSKMFLQGSTNEYLHSSLKKQAKFINKLQSLSYLITHYIRPWLAYTIQLHQIVCSAGMQPALSSSPSVPIVLSVLLRHPPEKKKIDLWLKPRPQTIAVHSRMLATGTT